MSGWTLVTGAGRGIGAAICRKLSEHGCDLLVHYRASQFEAERVAAECAGRGVRAESIQGDLGSPQSVQEFLGRVKAVGPVTQLVNNVGNYHAGGATETPDTLWYELMQTNFHAPRDLIFALRPELQAVVNLGMAGIDQMRADTVAPAYTVTKRALLALTLALSKELGPHGVRVNMVSPAWTERSVAYPNDVKKEIPLGRLARLDEIADAVAYLLQAEYITGQNLAVAGGACS